VPVPQRPSRRQQQEARKLLRERREAQKARRRRRQNWLVIGGSVLAGAAILGLVGLTIHNRGGRSTDLSTLSVSPTAIASSDPATTAATPAPDTSQTSTVSGVTFYTGMENKAVTTAVTYPLTPPVGGPYNPVWLNCGVYNDPVPNEYAVHSLERGAVWITYAPEIDVGDKQKLIKLTGKSGSSVTLSPYTGQTDPIVLTAWGAQLKVAKADDPRIAEFVKTFRNRSAAPEANAPCSGGIGQPRGSVLAIPSPGPGSDTASPTPSGDSTVTASATPAASPAP